MRISLIIVNLIVKISHKCVMMFPAIFTSGLCSTVVYLVFAPCLLAFSLSNGTVLFPYYPRIEWGAKPPTNIKPLNIPVPYVVIHHTAIPGACNTTDQCKRAMAGMQIYHIQQGWGDIGYHFCIGSEGGAYEGRGWHTLGIHAGRANNYSIGICLIGDWRVNLPPAKQLDTTRELIVSGVKLGVISPSYKLVGHNQIMSTECPGNALLQEIATWNNYVPGHVEFKK